MAHGLKYLAALMAAENGVQRFLQLNASPGWFVGTDEEAYVLITNHVEKYGDFPKAEALKGIELPEAQEDPAFYLSKLKHSHMHGLLTKGLSQAASALNDSNQHMALDHLKEAVLDCMRTDNENRIMDYAGQGYDVLNQHMLAVKKGLIPKVRLGWKTLDNVTNGLAPGDVVSIVGRPANGKTFMLLWAALFAWGEGHVPLVFSMEMNHISITERLASMQSDVNLNQIKHVKMSTTKKANLQTTLLGNQGQQPFWLVDGAMSATVEDVIMYANHLKPSIVLIDGAYLMKTREFMPRWERNTTILERLKGEVAESLGIPVVISYQLNREATKKTKKGKEAGLEDIGYTDAVGQISSIVLGMLEEENISTKKKREVRILKGRDGQTGKFLINWQFVPHLGLDFSEVTHQTTADLKYLK